ASCGPTGSGSGSRSGRGATRAVTGTTTSVATSSFTRTRAASIGRMRRGLAFSLAALAVALCSASCGSAKHELAPSPRVANFALRRSGAAPHRVAIGGISMDGFGSLDLGRKPHRFCAVGGHSPAVFFRGSPDASFGFDNAADFRRHDLIGIARHHSPYDAPVWIDVGNRDHLRPAATKLADELQADGADVTFHVWPGEHTGRYWDAHFAQYLDFYAK